MNTINNLTIKLRYEMSWKKRIGLLSYLLLTPSLSCSPQHIQINGNSQAEESCSINPFVTDIATKFEIQFLTEEDRYSYQSSSCGSDGEGAIYPGWSNIALTISQGSNSCYFPEAQMRLKGNSTCVPYPGKSSLKIDIGRGDKDNYDSAVFPREFSLENGIYDPNQYSRLMSYALLTELATKYGSLEEKMSPPLVGLARLDLDGVLFTTPYAIEETITEPAFFERVGFDFDEEEDAIFEKEEGGQDYNSSENMWSDSLEEGTFSKASDALFQIRTILGEYCASLEDIDYDLDMAENSGLTYEIYEELGNKINLEQRLNYGIVELITGNSDGILDNSNEALMYDAKTGKWYSGIKSTDLAFVESPDSPDIINGKTKSVSYNVAVQSQVGRDDLKIRLDKVSEIINTQSVGELIEKLSADLNQNGFTVDEENMEQVLSYSLKIDETTAAYRAQFEDPTLAPIYDMRDLMLNYFCSEL